MKSLSWKYTQYSQFNQSDTLLLVSGVHFGTPHSTSGEIAVFSVTEGSHLKCRVVNRPYDIFGTWFSDQHLLSGDLHWLAHLVSTSVLWLNKANQEIDSEHVPIMNQLYKFYNRNASSIRAIMIANCPWMQEEQATGGQGGEDGASGGGGPPATSGDEDDDDEDQCAGNPLSHYRVNYMNPGVGKSYRNLPFIVVTTTAFQSPQLMTNPIKVPHQQTTLTSRIGHLAMRTTPAPFTTWTNFDVNSKTTT
jgi:F-box and WD-40 domain protein 5